MRTNFAVAAAPVAFVIAMAVLVSGPGSAAAQETASVAIAVKGHQFQPAEIHAPASKRLAIRVKNFDATAMEFESVSLRVEKVIAPGTEGVVNVRALSPGRYEFFDDFHQEARGTLVVQ